MQGITMKLSDIINATDAMDVRSAGIDPKVLPRTQVLAGYDYYVDKNGMSHLGEVIFEGENQIVLGGAILILEKLFNVRSTLSLDSLNTIMSIANTGSNPTQPYPVGRDICLFGVGTGGAGDSITSIKESKFYEREIKDMVPFRVIDGELQGEDANKYFFKKQVNLQGNKNAFYLKKFAKDPVIKILWKDGEGDEDGTPLTQSPHAGSRSTPIETFAELVLQIDKKDVREWFQLNGNTEQTRINSLALFSGVLADVGGGKQDYKDVRMFSKLNIDNEMLKNLKTLTFIYRIFTS